MSQNRADVLPSKCFELHERLALFSNNCVYMYVGVHHWGMRWEEGCAGRVISHY